MSEIIEPGFRQRVQGLSLYECAEETCRYFGLYGKTDEFLLPFLQNVMNFVQKQGNDLSGYLSYWEDKRQKLAIDIPDGLNAVRIMSVHKSKGLEFPVVFYPQMGKYNMQNSAYEWITIPDNEQLGFSQAYLPLKSGTGQNTPSELNRRYEIEKATQLRDEINVMYVATTRPKYCFFGYIRNEGKLTDLEKFLPQALQKIDSSFEESGIYISGNLDKKYLESATSQLQEFLHPYSASWRKRVSISLPYLDNNTQPSARKYGQWVHLVLSEIDTAAEMTTAISKLAKNGHIDATAASQIESELTAILEMKEIAPFFEPGWEVLNEQGILVPGETNWYRPDRVICKNNEAVVIDFKTGNPREQDQWQVSQYMDLLREMNYQPVSGYLLYTSKKELKPVTSAQGQLF